MNAAGPPMQIVRHGEDAPPGVCGRWMGTAPCGAVAIAHAIWDLDVRNSLVCGAHETEARDAVHAGLHPYAPAVCSHPEARWYADVDLCAVDYPVGEGVTEAAVRAVRRRRTLPDRSAAASGVGKPPSKDVGKVGAPSDDVEIRQAIPTNRWGKTLDQR